MVRHPERIISMRRRPLLFVLLVLTPLVAAGETSRPAGLVVARDGRPEATIVIAKSPTLSAEFAATELAYHIRKITGASLPVVSDDVSVKGRQILVGESKATQAMGLRNRDFKSQEYLIRLLPDALVLIGRDQEGRDAAGETNRSWVDPAWGPGRIGHALRFDGAKTVVSVADSGFSDDAGSMEAWVWLPEESPSREGTILRLDGANPWTYHIVQRVPGRRQIIYQTYDGKEVTAVTSAELSVGWHHVLATHGLSDHRIELFVDGATAGSAKFTQSTCRAATLGIGGIAPGLHGAAAVGNPFTGFIDEVRISRVVRKPERDASGGPYVADGETTLLLHCDEGQGRVRDSSGNPVSLNMPGFFEENGTLWAVYDFLERCCGVRWYLPSEIGMVCPESKTLRVQGEEVRRLPAMSYRWITPTALFVPTPSQPVSPTDNTLWRLRIRQGGQQYQASHSFYGYYDRFLKDHPEWFAKGYSGQPPQMCYTHPGFVAQVVQDARDYFDGKGAKTGAQAMGDFFALCPMDNMSWCKCPTCQAELNRAEEKNPQFNNGKASDYVWGFVNKVAREVRATHPKKYIAALAYSDYAYYPTRFRLEANIAVQLCLHVRNWWCPSMEANDLKVLDQFTREAREAGRPVYLWLYYCFPALQAKYDRHGTFPGFFAHTVVRQMKRYHEVGIRGIFMEHSSEFDQSHLGDVPDMYVTWKLAEDPTLDGDALIDEFFKRYYGAASVPMQRLYARLEETFSNPASYPEAIRRSPAHQHQTEELAWRYLGTPDRMKEFGGLLAEARRAARTDVERRRIEMFAQGVWEPMLAGARQYAGKSK